MDKRLTQEEKQQIMDSNSLSEFHFGLGTWIRNYWISMGEKEYLASLLTDLGEKVESSGEGEEKIYFFRPPDFTSSTILEADQKHLKEKKSCVRAG